MTRRNGDSPSRMINLRRGWQVTAPFGLSLSARPVGPGGGGRMQQRWLGGLGRAVARARALIGGATVAIAQGEVVTPNENLVTEGMPPIPRTLAERAAPYMEFRAAALAAWHPQRREVLIA